MTQFVSGLNEFSYVKNCANKASSVGVAVFLGAPLRKRVVTLSKISDIRTLLCRYRDEEYYKLGCRRDCVVRRCHSSLCRLVLHANDLKEA
ncbi:MAG: hypothetical protein K0R08_1847 [Solimicrobium sp.]|nr:hypothetical protein [Solimicrobium sp.]